MNDNNLTSLPADVPDDVRNEIQGLQGDVFYLLKITGLNVIPHWVSDSIHEVFGASVDDCLNEPQWWSNGLHLDDKIRAQEGMVTVLKDGVLDHSYRFRHADGHYLTVEDHLKVFKHDGRASYIAGAWTVMD